VIGTLISSKTRIKLLLKFFLNSNTTAYLRNLEEEFGESSNAIRVELNKFEEAGMLSSFLKGNKKIFRANTAHPLFQEIHNILLKQLGIDRIIEEVIDRLGYLERVYLVGEFARGLDSDVIDLIFIGDVDKNYLFVLIEKAEKIIKRKIRHLIYTSQDFNYESWVKTAQVEPLLLWAQE
jgi:hypothetical protein